jgi:EmrB/QacA subfamily drug resistance transporter
MPNPRPGRQQPIVGVVTLTASEPVVVRRNVVLAICCLSLFIVGMDVTIVNIALPAIRADLHASLSGLQWTIDAYTLVIASLLMLAGSTGDRIGRKRVFRIGLVVFTIGSLLCSLAPGLSWLVLARAVQAVGGSMLNPVALSIIVNVFTEPRDRARAIGVWGSVIGLSMGFGPIVGGLLIESVGWRGIFWVNIPIGLAALLLTTRFVPESKAERARRADPIGQVLVAATLTTLIYAIIEAPRIGWGDPQTLTLFALAALGAGLLIVVELHRRDPLIEMRFFTSVPFAGATVTAVLAFGAFSGFLFLITLYLQEIRGYSALRAGLCLIPMAIALSVLAPVSGRVVGSRGVRIPLVLAGIAVVASALMLRDLDAGTSIWLVLTGMAVFGIGFGLVNAPITNSAVSGMPTSQAGVAAAVASTSRQVGAALGVAVIGSVLRSGLPGGSIGAHGAAVDAAFAAASRPAWTIIGVCGLGVVGMGLINSSAWARRTSRRVALA